MIVVLVLLILGAIFLLLKQQRKIQKLKTNTDKVYRKTLEEKYRKLEEDAQQEFRTKQKSYSDELSYLKKELEDLNKIINLTKEIFKIIFNPIAMAPFIIGVFVS